VSSSATSNRKPTQTGGRHCIEPEPAGTPPTLRNQTPYRSSKTYQALMLACRWRLGVVDSLNRGTIGSGLDLFNPIRT